MSDPLVSICLPTYNYAHYLPESISSCLGQSYGRLEVIVVDDASADDSREVIKSFDDPRIRFIENAERLGLVENWNKTLTLARGEIVKFMFADDRLEETAVERMVEELSDPNVNLVFCSAKIIDASGNHTRTHQPYPESRYLRGRDEAKRCVKEGNYIGAPTAVAVRRSALEHAGKFDETLRFHADQEMWIRLLLDGDGYFISDPLVSTREHGGSETSRLERTAQIEVETKKFLNHCLQDERIRALLSKSEVRELTDRRTGASVTGKRRMKDLMKRLVEGTPFYSPLLQLRRAQLQRKSESARREAAENEVAEWERRGRPAPPPHLVKERALRHYASQYGLRILVETGTFMGDMVEAMKNSFDKVYSIELSEELFRKAKERFAGDRNVELIQGDSGKMIASVAKELAQPALFWLDGHYSAGETARGETDTPIFEELTHILNARPLNHVVIIDDARLFGSDSAYPTIEELKEFVLSKRESVITVEDDSIRIVLRGGENTPTPSRRETL